MAGIDLINFPNSKMGAAIAAGTSRFRVYGTDTIRFPNSKMGNAVALGVSRFLSLQVTGPPVAPANTGLPVISGTLQAGFTLTTTRGTWSGTFATYTYQWKRGGVNIAGATSNSYTLTNTDVGAMISVTVTATNSAGNASATAIAVGPVITGVPTNTVLPVISGSAVNGNVLTTSNGTWTGTPTIVFTYQWTRNGSAIAGAINQNYTLVTADVGANIAVVVTGTNTLNTANAFATAIGPVLDIPVLALSGNTIFDVAPIGVTIGIFTITGGTGTYTYALTSSPSGYFAISGSNLNVAAAMTIGSYPITVTASGGTPSPVVQNFTIIVSSSSGASLDFSDPNNSQYIPGIL